MQLGRYALARHEYTFTNCVETRRRGLIHKTGSIKHTVKLPDEDRAISTGNMHKNLVTFLGRLVFAMQLDT